jgi:hypothetical protein
MRSLRSQLLALWIMLVVSGATTRLPFRVVSANLQCTCCTMRRTGSARLPRHRRPLPVLRVRLGWRAGRRPAEAGTRHRGPDCPFQRGGRGGRNLAGRCGVARPRVPFLRGYGAKDRPSGSRREHHPRGERGGVAVGPARRHSPNRTIANAPGAGMSAARAAPGDDRLDHDQDVYSRRAGLHAVAGGPGRAGPDDLRLGSLARSGALFLVAQDCAARGRSRQRQQRFGRSSNATEDRRTRTRPAGGRIEQHGKEARARATARRRRRTPRRRRAAFCRPCSS